MGVKKNLLRVIEALEYMQKENYSPFTNLTLSYLYDIRDNKVPNNLVTDLKYKKMKKNGL